MLLVFSSKAYSVKLNIQRKDHQCSLACNSTLGNDWLHYTKHWIHMNQDKDLYTFHWHMHESQGIRNSVYILVCSLVADQYNFVRKSILADHLHRGIERRVHKGMECKDFQVLLKLVVLLDQKEFIFKKLFVIERFRFSSYFLLWNILWRDLQHSLEDNCILDYD